MINLLPPNEKRQIIAGRANIILVRYVFILVFGIAFLGLFTLTIYLLITNIKTNAEDTILQNSGKTSSCSSVQAQATVLRSNLTTAKSILDNEISYSSAILRIAQIVPDGVVLNGLSLSSSTFGTPTTITARAKTNAAAVALKDAFQNYPLYFSNVSFQSLNASSNSSDYPIVVVLNVTINKEAAKK